jgi:hypothetical protein
MHKPLGSIPSTTKRKKKMKERKKEDRKVISECLVRDTTGE